jgi:hypothetical protein
MSRPDAARLLPALADALNACERAGITVQLAHGAAWTRHGYVLPAGDPRIGSLWAARPALPGVRGDGAEISEQDGPQVPLSRAADDADLTAEQETVLGMLCAEQRAGR